jgi:predicted CopG family antitoxin
MSRDGLFGNLLKVAGAGALLYLAYKLGEQHANQNLVTPREPVQPIQDTIYEDVVEEKTEEEDVIDLIQELRNKPNKNKNDRYNIELLEIKLKQIRGQK